MRATAARRAIEESYTPVTAIWPGATVFCLGGGPSLAAVPFDRLREAQAAGAKVVAANSAVLLFPSADCLFFTDNGWFDRHRDLVAAFPGLVMTVSRRAKGDLPERVCRVVVNNATPDFLVGAGPIKDGRSSGHRIVSLAIAFGAARVVLLGFDMRAVDGRTHGHDDYPARPRDVDLYAREFIPAFRGWQAAAGRAGVEVLNATPGSALAEFPIVPVETVL